MIRARLRRWWHCFGSADEWLSCRPVTVRDGWRVVLVACGCGRIFDFDPYAFRAVLEPFEALPERTRLEPGTGCQIKDCERGHVTQADYDDTIYLVCREHAALRGLFHYALAGGLKPNLRRIRWRSQ